MVRRKVKRKVLTENVVNGKVQDYRFVDEKRKNIPDAGLASYYKEKRERKKYEYDPHLDPQLVWAGKAEGMSFEIDTIALHIHERVSTKAILKTVEKKELYEQLRLFGEPNLPWDKRIEFYQHEMDWTNRLILGDSLLVMNSLIERELMAGKVQTIYVDPPYGKGYSSNFQPNISKVNVQDGKDDSLTREPEQIKAYRDTWELGVHSYLSYLRDRLLLCKELLANSGSIFVQIGDENVHHAKELLDEIFQPENFVSLITFRKKNMPFGAQHLERMSDYLLWYAKSIGEMKYRPLFVRKDIEGASRWTKVQLPDGSTRNLTTAEWKNHALLPKGSRVYCHASLKPSGFTSKQIFEVEFKGKKYDPPYSGGWSTTREGMMNLIKADRIEPENENLRYKLFFDDYPVSRLMNLWNDTSGASNKIYVVQTMEKVVERCILMTTDPGDLVLDPTCGSGTTAYVAEQWGRRWITCDTSRVAIALARHRLMTAVYPYYELSHPDDGVKSGFIYETVSHITLGSIANNEPPAKETLYDRPKVSTAKVRVSGPFTFEAIPVPSIEVQLSGSIEHREIETLSTNVAADYVSVLIDLVRKDGITFPGGKHMPLENVIPIQSSGFLHAEAQVRQNGDTARVALSFGPRYSPVTFKQVEEAVRSAYMMGFNMLVFAGFAFDPEAQATIQKNPHPNLQIHTANIRPDVEMSDLLKSPRGSQLFTVFGQPDVMIKKAGDEYIAKLLGVDIYDPTKGEVHSSKPEDVAAWFLDQNYDGYTFCITQVFFPKEATNRNPWDKLENALHGIVDKKRIETLRGTTSLPFKSGDQERIAVKVIDQRGNEVIVVKKLAEVIQG